MDEDATWYGSRPRHRPHCRRVPSAARKGHSTPPSFRPMSIVATVAHLSYTAELLLECPLVESSANTKFWLHMYVYAECTKSSVLKDRRSVCQYRKWLLKTSLWNCGQFATLKTNLGFSSQFCSNVSDISYDIQGDTDLKWQLFLPCIWRPYRWWPYWNVAMIHATQC